VAAIDMLGQLITQFAPHVAYVHAVYHPGLIRWLVERLPTVAYVHSPYLVCPGSAQYLRRSERVCPHAAGLICLINAQRERCCWGRNPWNHVLFLMRVRAFIRAYEGVQLILVGSRYMQRLLQRNGIPGARISVLPPVIGPRRLSSIVPAEESNTILFAGRLVPAKGLHHLVRALATIQSDWKLIVAGEGEERLACAELAHGLGVARSVHFVGWLDEREMQARIKASAAVAVPSLWPEPYGRVGPEAFFCARPVVAYAVGGIPEWLDDGVSGYLISPGDVVGLGQTIGFVLERPRLRAQMGQRARQYAVSTWRASAHVEQLIRRFQQALRRA
jgi:glycosyltransferase involved in cell wall biosynthesis